MLQFCQWYSHLSAHCTLQWKLQMNQYTNQSVKTAILALIYAFLFSYCCMKAHSPSMTCRDFYWLLLFYKYNYIFYPLPVTLTLTEMLLQFKIFIRMFINYSICSPQCRLSLTHTSTSTEDGCANPAALTYTADFLFSEEQIKSFRFCSVEIREVF